MLPSTQSQCRCKKENVDSARMIHVQQSFKLILFELK